MEKPSYKLVGAPCGHHGQYTFYKALRVTGPKEKIIAIGDFFFVKIWQDSELVSIGELQLLWTDRVSDQTLVSLRLYFLPENTPEGRNNHGEDEVLAISEKVVLRAEDLLSWLSDGASWRWGLRAVWRGACTPPPVGDHSAPLHSHNLDFSDVDQEKNSIVDDSPGVVVFSYPRYCRYRAVVARLEGMQAAWLRDSLVAALGGYAAPNAKTSILYCKDTFEYPELEGHEFVCNHLAPKMKGRPRGRRRRVPRSRSHSPSSRSSDSETATENRPTPRRLSLRNGPSEKNSDEENSEDRKPDEELDKEFLQQLKNFYRERGTTFKVAASFKDISLRSLYLAARRSGGHAALTARRAWKRLRLPNLHTSLREAYERYLLPYENHERKLKLYPSMKPNGKLSEPRTIDTIEVADSPLREEKGDVVKLEEKRLCTPSPKPKIDNETGEPKEPVQTDQAISLSTEDYLNSPENSESEPKTAEQINREFLASLPSERPMISVKPVEELLDPSSKFLEKCELEDGKSGSSSEGGLVIAENCAMETARSPSDLTALQAPVPLEKMFNGHPTTTMADQKYSRPAGRSSLRAVRVKPTRPQISTNNTPPTLSTTQSVLDSNPTTATNFSVHRPQLGRSDDDIVEVPYKPKSPEIIDLDEYPESPQSVKKKKLDILKERGLEVTPVPSWTGQVLGPGTIITSAPIISPSPIILPVQHPIMTQAQLFQMYMVPNYPNGIQPPKVIQASCFFGSSSSEKIVYGNPKDPFMPPPHVIQGAPIKPPRSIQTTTTPKDILDLTCKGLVSPSQKPAVEIVKIPTTPSPSKSSNNPQNLTKNYTLVDGKAVVGSNLEITLVNPKNQSPSKNRPPQKRSSNGKFVSTKTPTPPKDFPKSFVSPSQKKPTIVIPNYHARDEISPTSSSSSKDSQTSQNNLLNFKNQNPLSQILDMQKGLPVSLMDPVYMNALYSSFGQMDQRQLAMYRDIMSSQFRGYGVLNVTNTPTTKK